MPFNSGTYDLAYNQHLVLSGTRQYTDVNITGNRNSAEIDNNRSYNIGTINGHTDVLSINNPDTLGTRVFGDNVTYTLDGNHNTINLTGDMASAFTTLNGIANTLNFNGDFGRGDYVTVGGTHDTVSLDHVRSNIISVLPGGTEATGLSNINFIGPHDTLSLSNGSNAEVHFNNTVTQADTVEVLGNAFGRSNSVVELFNLTSTDGVLDLDGLAFKSAGQIYNHFISHPTTLGTLTGYALHLPGKTGEVFIAGSDFTKANFQP